MTLRTFRLAHTAAGMVAHDPCTGLTHRGHQARAGADVEGAQTQTGRVRLDDRIVAAWPVIHPRELAGPMPVSVCWSPIVRCNLHCPHCLDDKAVPEAGRDRRAEVAGHLAAAGVLGVDISGGEPLLLADLPALADRLTAGGCVVSVTTNGWHLARRAAALAGSVDAVRVSLDGPDAALHDRWRGAGSYRRALAGLRACAALDIPTQLQTVLMASTRQAAQQMVDLAAAQGVHGLTLLQMLPIGEGVRLADAELLSDTDARAVLDRLAVPPGLKVRLRERDAADGFTVVRADATVWRNHDGAHLIGRCQGLTRPADLALGAVPDGSA